MWERQLSPRWGLDEFERDCRQIVAAWKDRQGRKPAERQLQLEQETYDLIGFMLDQGLDDLWGARKLRLDQRGAKGSGNPFAIGLRMIFAYERDPLPFRKRELVSLRLMYASRHYVPSAFLRSFLGGVTLRPDLDRIKPGFELWIALQMRQSNDDGWRGEYPPDICELEDRLPPKSKSDYRDQTEAAEEERDSIAFLEKIDALRDENGNIRL